MSLQNKLTVAEGLFLLNTRCSPEDIIGYTLGELMMLDVIRIVNIMERVHARDPVKTRIRFIVPGKNFEGFRPEFHQEIFTAFLQNHHRFPMKLMARKIVIKHSLVGFKTNVLKPHLANELMLKRAKGIPSLTDYGKRLRRQLKDELKNFRKLFRKDPNNEAIRKVIQNLGALVLLEPKIRFAELENLSESWNTSTPSTTAQAHSLFAWNNIGQVRDSELFAKLDAIMNSFERGYKNKEDVGYGSNDSFIDYFDF